MKNLQILLFTSPTCGPCKQLKPNMVKLQSQHQFKMRLVELGDDTRSQFEGYGVRQVPFVICEDVESGERVGQFFGAQALPILEDKLKKWGVIPQ